MPKFILTTAVLFAALQDKNPNALYFIQDTGEIYKGDQPYTESVVFVDELPQFAGKGKMYILKSTLECMIHNGTEWKTIVPEIHTSLTDEVQAGLASAEAVKEYVKKKILEMVSGGEVEINTDTVVTTKDIQIKGQTLGSYKDGDVIPAGESLTTILTKQFAKQIAPSYSSPSMSISPGSASHESGTKINLNVNSTFNKRDAGSLTKYVLTRTYEGKTSTLVDGLSIVTQNEADMVVEDGGRLSYTSKISYADGEIKNDNLGMPYPQGSIKAGTIQQTSTYTGQRKAFYGKGTQTIKVANSNEVRVLPLSVMNPNNGTKLTINISVGDTRITFAYPATLRDVTSVISSALNLDVKATFEQEIIKVEGANGYNAIDYKVFTYIPAIPFGTSDTYTVTI